MAKKNFKTGIDSLISGSESTTKRGRPKVSTKVPTKSSEIGTKEGEVRATFIVNVNQHEDIKALAYLDRDSIKTILGQAIDAYLTNRHKDIAQARKLYNARTSKD